MSKLHYTEIFYSIQGEARYMGVPSIFIRMFGCNFRCKMFGRNMNTLNTTETHNPDVVNVIKDIDKYKTFKDLPLVTTGCDSYSSIYPEFKRFVNKETADEVVNNIINLLPFNKWKDEHLVITGGEPLLGWQKAYPDLLFHEKMGKLKEITFETNGTQPLHADFKRALKKWIWEFEGYVDREVTFSVSPKLSVSGESFKNAIKPKIIYEYEQEGHFTYLKFVVATEEDVQEALTMTDLYRKEGFEGPVYLMPVGGVESVYLLNNKRVAELAMKYGLRYSDRLQVPLWKNQWGT